MFAKQTLDNRSYYRLSLNTLIILIGLAAVLLAGCAPAQKKSSAEIVRKVADEITGYTLPEGYSEQFAVHILDYQLVSLQGKTPSCHIYLVQAPKGTDIDLADLQDQHRSRYERDLRDLRVVETRTATLRGQESTVLVSEGINGEDVPYRSITALFEGRNGPAAVSISSPVDQWDWEQVDAFLASLD